MGRLDIGILDLLRAPAAGVLGAADGWWAKRRCAALMPQIVAVWCRRLGHRVHYATSYGIGDPSGALPRDLDIVFIACHTHLAPLASALARLHRARGTRTVVGGPHARAFPADCARWFDVTVLECDERVVADIVAGRFPPGSVVSAAGPPLALPPLAERLDSARRATFVAGRTAPGAVVPMLAGLGCPYACDFCVDAAGGYRALPADALVADVQCAAREVPRATLFFHDPNFGVGIDGHLDALAAAPRRVRYVAETSLGVVDDARAERLGATGCTLLAVGIESWSGFGEKAGTADVVGAARLDRTVARLTEIGRSVPYLQATFVLGLDSDAGDEPFALTEAFVRRAPGVWPYVNTPLPVSGTAFAARVRREGRLLTAMPFSCYKNPFLLVRPAHYEAGAYLERMADLLDAIAAPGMLRARLAVARSRGARLEHLARTLAARPHARWMRRVSLLARRESSVRAFHDGRTDVLPDIYVQAHARQIGAYAELMPLADCIPLRDAPPLAPIVLGTPSGCAATAPTSPVPGQPRPAAPPGSSPR